MIMDFNLKFLTVFFAIVAGFAHSLIDITCDFSRGEGTLSDSHLSVCIRKMNRDSKLEIICPKQVEGEIDKSRFRNDVRKFQLLDITAKHEQFAHRLLEKGVDYSRVVEDEEEYSIYPGNAEETISTLVVDDLLQKTYIKNLGVWDVFGTKEENVISKTVTKHKEIVTIKPPLDGHLTVKNHYVMVYICSRPKYLVKCDEDFLNLMVNKKYYSEVEEYMKLSAPVIGNGDPNIRLGIAFIYLTDLAVLQTGCGSTPTKFFTNAAEYDSLNKVVHCEVDVMTHPNVGFYCEGKIEPFNCLRVFKSYNDEGRMIIMDYSTYYREPNSSERFVYVNYRGYNIYKPFKGYCECKNNEGKVIAKITVERKTEHVCNIPAMLMKNRIKTILQEWCKVTLHPGDSLKIIVPINVDNINRHNLMIRKKMVKDKIYGFINPFFKSTRLTREDFDGDQVDQNQEPEMDQDMERLLKEEGAVGGYRRVRPDSGSEESNGMNVESESEDEDEEMVEGELAEGGREQGGRREKRVIDDDKMEYRQSMGLYERGEWQLDGGAIGGEERPREIENKATGAMPKVKQEDGEESERGGEDKEVAGREKIEVEGKQQYEQRIKDRKELGMKDRNEGEQVKEQIGGKQTIKDGKVEKEINKERDDEAREIEEQRLKEEKELVNSDDSSVEEEDLTECGTLMGDLVSESASEEFVFEPGPNECSGLGCPEINYPFITNFSPKDAKNDINTHSISDDNIYQMPMQNVFSGEAFQVDDSDILRGVVNIVYKKQPLAYKTAVQTLNYYWVLRQRGREQHDIIAGISVKLAQTHPYSFGCETKPSGLFFPQRDSYYCRYNFNGCTKQHVKHHVYDMGGMLHYGINCSEEETLYPNDGEYLMIDAATNVVTTVHRSIDTHDYPSLPKFKLFKRRAAPDSMFSYKCGCLDKNGMETSRLTLYNIKYSLRASIQTLEHFKFILLVPVVMMFLPKFERPVILDNRRSDLNNSIPEVEFIPIPEDITNYKIRLDVGSTCRLNVMNPIPLSQTKMTNVITSMPEKRPPYYTLEGVRHNNPVNGMMRYTDPSFSRQRLFPANLTRYFYTILRAGNTYLTPVEYSSKIATNVAGLKIEVKSMIGSDVKNYENLYLTLPMGSVVIIKEDNVKTIELVYVSGAISKPEVSLINEEEKELRIKLIERFRKQKIIKREREEREDRERKRRILEDIGRDQRREERRLEEEAKRREQERQERGGDKETKEENIGEKENVESKIKQQKGEESMEEDEEVEEEEEEPSTSSGIRRFFRMSRKNDQKAEEDKRKKEKQRLIEKYEEQKITRKMVDDIREEQKRINEMKAMGGDRKGESLEEVVERLERENEEVQNKENREIKYIKQKGDEKGNGKEYRTKVTKIEEVEEDEAREIEEQRFKEEKEKEEQKLKEIKVMEEEGAVGGVEVIDDDEMDLDEEERIGLEIIREKQKRDQKRFEEEESEEDVEDVEKEEKETEEDMRTKLINEIMKGKRLEDILNDIDNREKREEDIDKYETDEVKERNRRFRELKMIREEENKKIEKQRDDEAREIEEEMIMVKKGEQENGGDKETKEETGKQENINKKEGEKGAKGKSQSRFWGIIRQSREEKEYEERKLGIKEQEKSGKQSKEESRKQKGKEIKKEQLRDIRKMEVWGMYTVMIQATNPWVHGCGATEPEEDFFKPDTEKIIENGKVVGCRVKVIEKKIAGFYCPEPYQLDPPSCFNFLYYNSESKGFQLKSNYFKRIEHKNTAFVYLEYMSSMKREILYPFTKEKVYTCYCRTIYGNEVSRIEVVI